MKSIITVTLSVTISAVLLVAVPRVKNVQAQGSSQQDSSRDVLRNLDNFNKSLAGWMGNIDRVNERFDALQKNISDIQKSISESIVPITGMMGEIRAAEARMMAAVERVAAIERTASVTEITATLATFNRNLELLKRLIAEMGKRVEDQEVKTTVLEKRYQEAQRPLEPIRRSIEDLASSITARLSEQERKMTSVEETIAARVQSVEDRLAPVAELERKVKRLEAEGPAVAREMTERPSEAREKPEVPAPMAIAAAVKEVLPPTPEEEGYTPIGEGFYIRNAELRHFGSSSRIEGEIKNLSGAARSIAGFTIRIFNAADTLLFSQDFSIKGFKKDEMRTFNEIISGYSPIDITRYEITPRRRF
ncbi:MAG: coiled-coil domain-containing protein [Candidatus Loosdrechtia sp.]|uniref:coiled-coil domain-containing protein n=1 Tax=Candidatus Loosdrechtia sp. TaxID=3101272 RepID=UPI003A65EAE8|nr:MAG: hypothetical protein QY305_15115 [Candidatus Jettenia sp. AMX2]